MKIDLLSIIIPCYNKKQILLNTLQSISLHRGVCPIETIIIDDGSDEENRMFNLAELFPELNLRYIWIDKKKGWRGPTIAYNAGFAYANGNVIFLNGADCVHKGNLLGYVFDNMREDSYISFSALREQDEFGLDDPRAWHIHSKFFYALIPFCAAISTKSLELLGGFDERFADGVGYEDSDWDVRICNLGLDAHLIDDPYCLHQKHPLTQYPNQINRDLYFKLQKETPNRVKSPYNKIYNP